MSTSASKAHGASGARWTAGLGYVLMVVAGIGVFFLVRWVGEGLVAPAAPADAPAVGQSAAGSVDVVQHLLATMAAVIVLGHALGWLCKFIGQPPVIGEVLAGIVLGPSILGALSPAAMHALIPDAAADPHGQVTSALKAVSQLGVILYMFLVGLEVNVKQLKRQAHAAIAISHASILAPFLLGVLLALWLYPRLSHEGVPFTSFSLFMGVAMSITAFPVLARILTDRGLTRTDVGALALACAAIGDVTAWCLLALVVGVVQAQIGSSLLVSGWALTFILGMFAVVRPLVKWASKRLDLRSGSLPPVAIVGGFVAMLAASLTTELIGIHAVFGAFMLGAVIPPDSRLAHEFTTKLRDPVLVLLLPAFFAYMGMRTEIGLVSGGQAWLMCAVIIVVATAGKFVGTWAAARLAGQSRRDSAAIGVLMNTRGLMELIVLNIGLDLGVISPTLFAMMVLMALATTMATSPLLKVLLREPAAGMR